MRIAFLTNKTASTNLPIFERLVNSARVDLVHSFFYDTIAEFRRSPLQLATQFGSKQIVNKALEVATAEVRCRLGQRLGKSFSTTRSPYELAVSAGLAHSVIADLNQPETIRRLRSMNLDALLVCVCKNILRDEVLSLPDVEFINVHPSLLPRYRGPTPTFWMLFNGESETGVTFHRMTSRIDQGEILAQRRMPLDTNKSERQIEFDVFQLAAVTVEDVLQHLDSAPMNAAGERDNQQASYYTFPTEAERRELKHRLSKP